MQKKAIVAACTLIVTGWGQAQTLSNQAVEHDAVSHVLLSLDENSYSDQFVNLPEGEMPPTGPVIGVSVEGSGAVLEGGLGIELGKRRDTTALLLAQPDSLLAVGGSVNLTAQTAVEGAGTLVLSPDASGAGEAIFNGKVQMQAGRIMTTQSSLYFLDDAEIGQMTVIPQDADAPATIGRQKQVVFGNSQNPDGALVRIDALNLIDVQAHVSGFENHDPLEWGKGSTLMVKRLSASLTEVDGGVLHRTAQSITVAGNGNLVLGTYLDTPWRSTEDVTWKHLSGPELSRARLYALVADAQIVTGQSQGATLVVDAAMQGLSDGVAIFVGKAHRSEKPSGVIIGKDSRLVIDFTDWNAVAPACPVSIDFDGEANIVLYDWDGSTYTFDAQAPQAVHVYPLNGLRASVMRKDGAITIERVRCADLPGLHSRALVRYVEDGYQAGDSELRPGFGFIADSFSEMNVGQSAYANVVDSAVFLPVSSGLLSASEQAHREFVSEQMLRDMQHDGQTRWWALAWGGEARIDCFYRSSGRDLGVKAQTSGVAFGFDTSLGRGWTGSIGLGGVALESDVSGSLVRMHGSGTMAGVSVQFEKMLDDGRLRLGAIYAQAKLEAVEPSVNRHRLEAEPDARHVTLAARWTGGQRGVSHWRVTPVVDLSVNWADVRAAGITDSDSYMGIHGKGFELQVKDRLWAEVGAGGEFSDVWQIANTQVSPHFGGSLSTAVGQLKWRARSQLPGASQSQVRDNFQGAPTVMANVWAEIDIARSGKRRHMEGGFFGLGAHETGKMDLWSWTLGLKTHVSVGDHGRRDARFGIDFRQIL